MPTICGNVFTFQDISYVLVFVEVGKEITHKKLLILPENFMK